VRIFDNNSDGATVREMIAVHFPSTSALLIFECVIDINFNRSVKLQHVLSEALSIARVNCLRPRTYDLVVATIRNGLLLFALGHNPLPLQIGDFMDRGLGHATAIVGLTDDIGSCATLIFADSSRSRARFKIRQRDGLVSSALEAISMTIPGENFCALLLRFLHHSQTSSMPGSNEDDVDCLRRAIADTFNIPSIIRHSPSPEDPWTASFDSNARKVFDEDPAMKFLRTPQRVRPSRLSLPTMAPHPMLTPTFNTFHTWLEDQRLSLATEHIVIKMASLICDIGMVIRPEWADYWKRLVPEALPEWPSPHNACMLLVQYCLIHADTDSQALHISTLGWN
jgi:anaphase-promoting complex subunit 1